VGATSATEVFNLEDKGEQLKQQFEKELNDVLTQARSNQATHPTPEIVRTAHAAATTFFNHYEQFVGRSDLLQVQHHEDWARNFYETCYNVLHTITIYYDVLQDVCTSSGADWTIYKPSPMAYASMQRLVYNKLVDRRQEVLGLKDAFEKLNLPAGGFAQMRVKSLSAKERVMSYVFGVVFVVAVLVAAVVFPDPSAFQYLVFRWVMSLAAAGVGAVLPGFLMIEGTIGKFAIRSGGAVALFVVVYFLNPQVLPS